MSDSFGKQLVMAAALGAIPVVSTCVLIPLTIYAGNNTEFAVAYLDYLHAISPFVAILVIAFGLFSLLTDGSWYRRYLAVVAALGILVWLQGNILVWDYGVLDGRKIDWLAGSWRGVLDITLWIVVLGVAFAAYERCGRTLILAAACSFAIQLVSAATVAVSQAQALRAPSEIELNDSAGEAITRFSTERNVVHMVMDGFQADVFSAIIDDPANAGLREQLDGFTFFRDNLGAFPYTQMSIPAFLGAKLYRNKVPMNEFMGNVLQGNTILNAALNAGYEVDIAAPIPLKNIYGLGNYTHAYGISSGEGATKEHYVRADLARLLDLSLFRVLPHFVKPLIYRDRVWLFQPFMQNRVNWVIQYFADLSFLSHLAESMTVGRNTPVYKLIHVMLSHQPTVGNDNCEFDGMRPTNRSNVTKQARCGLIGVAAVLQRMRQLGIYDQSLIVLMGDHGAWVPIEGLRNEQDYPAGMDALWLGMATPALAVKPPNSSGSLQISYAPTSTVDLPATISNLLALETEFDGTPVFSIGNDALRTRRHLYYEFGTNPHAKEFLNPMTEYRVDGQTLNADAWHLDARHFPAGQNGD